jgi:hypothetical protein
MPATCTTRGLTASRRIMKSANGWSGGHSFARMPELPGCRSASLQDIDDQAHAKQNGTMPRPSQRKPHSEQHPQADRKRRVETGDHQRRDVDMFYLWLVGSTARGEE